MNNTAGSYALVGAKVPADSTIARKLRESGAIILGKTNPITARGGQTYGPYFPQQDPSGSSSGSAVAATLGLATVCLGVETSGSIIAPSHYNNIVDMKPTVGLTSRHLVVPVSEHMDTIGPMTKTVKDAAYFLRSIAGVDPSDNYTSAIPHGADLDFVNACNISALKGARLGIPQNVISLMSNNSTGSMLEAFNKSLAILRSAGAIIIENTDFPAAQESIDNALLTVQVVATDFVVAVEKHLSSLVYNPHNITNLADLRQWTQSSSLEDYPNKPTDVWDAALRNWNNADYEYWRAYQQALYWGNQGGLLGVIKRYELDAAILPSLYSWNWAAVIGAPIISVPMGAMPPDQPIVSDADGLVSAGPNIPFGFSFLGARFTDAKLIGLAYAFEQRTMKRKTVHPHIKPRTDLRDEVGMQNS
ncbi:hypothetical protein BPOR_0353g00060 [Botrytis porri]|uniref:Amidase domain-containing protein n=1 Tax=Botrytis porri TaxID=87229 RepID=A0A4Z1KNK2_9HELO|nr:hypothetical protein BPOR_0353g00060 [Botrytis porri]